MPTRLAALAFLALLLGSSVLAQDLTPEARQTMERADVKRAFDYIDAHRDQILAEWIALTEINAPSGKERDRAEAVRKLPIHHRDPFDRMLVAQARVEALTLVSRDPALRLYDAPVVWA